MLHADPYNLRLEATAHDRKIQCTFYLLTQSVMLLTSSFRLILNALVKSTFILVYHLEPILLKLFQIFTRCFFRLLA